MEALAAEYERIADNAKATWNRKAGESRRYPGDERGFGHGEDTVLHTAERDFRTAARMLRGALAAEAPSASTFDVRIARASAAERGVGFGASWGEPPREIPEAGAGLWRVISLWTVEGGDVMIKVTR